MFVEGQAGAQPPTDDTPLADGQQQQPALPQDQQQDDSPESGAQDAKPEKDRIEKRIGHLTWKAHDAERRLNAEMLARQRAEDQLAAMQRQQLELAHRASMPSIEQYPDQQAYQRAMYEHNQQYLAHQQRLQQEAQQRQQAQLALQSVQNKLATRVAEALPKYPDFLDVVGNPALSSIADVNPPLFAALLDHEQMPEILYHLAKNPSEAQRIAYLPPARAILEVGKVAAALAAAPAGRASSQAPEPPAQIGSNRSAPDSRPRDDDSIESWVRKREAQIRARNKGR
jgi:hypothetical protein